MGKFRQILEKTSEIILEHLIKKLDFDLSVNDDVTDNIVHTNEKADAPAADPTFTYYFKYCVGSIIYPSSAPADIAKTLYHDEFTENQSLFKDPAKKQLTLSQVMNSNNIKCDVDCGQSKLYSTSDIKSTTQLQGILQYVNTYSSVSGYADNNSGFRPNLLDIKYNFIINDIATKQIGTISAVCVTDAIDSKGRLLANKEIELRITYGNGAYANSTGKIVVKNTGANKVVKVDFYLADVALSSDISSLKTQLSELTTRLSSLDYADTGSVPALDMRVTALEQVVFAEGELEEAEVGKVVPAEVAVLA